MSVDWVWCYENPEQAAAQIELLRATLDADRDGSKKLAAERDKWFDKTQSDAKVIAALRKKILNRETFIGSRGLWNAFCFTEAYVNEQTVGEK